MDAPTPDAPASPTPDTPTPPTPLPLGAPLVHPPTPDLKTLHAALLTHAHAHGFAIAKDSSRPTRQTWVCSRAGRYNPKGKTSATTHPSKQRRANTRSSKTGCPYRVSATRRDPDADPGADDAALWTLVVKCNNHNHSAAAEAAALPQYRRAGLTEEVRRAIAERRGMGWRPRRILRELQERDPGCELVARDISNAVAGYPVRQMGGETETPV